MAVNHYYHTGIATLFLTFATFFVKTSCACDLVPFNDETCFELSASPYITNETSQFGPTIEGASVNTNGDIFAVNYGSSESTHQLGQVFPQQRLFYSDTNTGSFFNGIRFLNSVTALVADVTNHRILKLTVGDGNVVTNSTNYCSDANMLQPNDLTVSKTGTVFTSGMNWLADTDDTDGDIWSCLPHGTAKRLELLGRTNGIELSPDEKHLYVSESYNRAGLPVVQRIWRYNTNIEEGTISGKKLFADFDSIDKTSEVDIDGMKTDINGNLFVTRHSANHVAVFSPQGALIGKIALNFPRPTNLEFGGVNGTTLYIVGECAQEGKGCVDHIEVNTPGRSWTMLQASSNAWRTFHIKSHLRIFSSIVVAVLFLVRV